MGKVVKMSAEEFADKILSGKTVYSFAKEKNNDNKKDYVFNYNYWYFVRPVVVAGMTVLLFCSELLPSCHYSKAMVRGVFVVTA